MPGLWGARNQTQGSTHARQALPIPSRQVYLCYPEEHCCEHGRTGISMDPVLIFFSMCIELHFELLEERQPKADPACPHLTAISGYNLTFGL